MGIFESLLLGFAILAITTGTGYSLLTLFVADQSR